MSAYTLEEKIAYATDKLEAAKAAQARADALYEQAREQGGGIPGFGGSGSQRAAQIVRGSYDRAFRAGSEADERAKYWEQKLRSYTRRLTERDRVRLTRDDALGAVAIRDQFGWRTVLKVNAKTVTVRSTLHPDWTDRVPFEKVLEVRK